MTYRVRLTVPADRRIELELPAEITGEVEITVCKVARAVSPEDRQRAVALARKSRASISKTQSTDSTDLIREDRAR